MVIIEGATLHAGTCLTSSVITYFLDSLRWIHGAMHVKERVEYNRSRVITYRLDSSSWIHGAMHEEERVEYHRDYRNGYTPCRHMQKE